VILFIDTSSRVAVLATIEADRVNEIHEDTRSPELHGHLRRLVRDNTITKVAVVTGPGSFTGLRTGVSFGLGLALGLKIPIVALPTLELQAARSGTPATAIVEAGRGRFYHLPPGGEAALGEPGEIPTTFPLVGWISPEGRPALERAGHRLMTEETLLSVGAAAALKLEAAPEVPYGSLRVEYMQSFTARI
jgi:hypothetical protein